MSARQFDPGPPSAFETLFAALPAARSRSASISGSTGARSSTVAGSTARPGSWPSPRTRAPRNALVGRTLVGDAGQRVQGLLRQDRPRSLVCPRPTPSPTASSRATGRRPRRSSATRSRWPGATSCTTRSPARTSRRSSRSASTRQYAVDHWPTAPAVPIHRLPHPSSHSEPKLLRCLARGGHRVAWPGDARPGRPDEPPELRRRPSPNPTTRRSRRRDLPFGVPAFVGNDAWVRATGGREQRQPARRRTPSSGWPPGPPAAGTRHPDAHPLRPHRPRSSPSTPPGRSTTRAPCTSPTTGSSASRTPRRPRPPAASSTSPCLDTAGTIYPGLIELHNHLPYDVLQLWQGYPSATRIATNGAGSGPESDRRLISGPMTVLGKIARTDGGGRALRRMQGAARSGRDHHAGGSSSSPTTECAPLLPRPRAQCRVGTSDPDAPPTPHRRRSPTWRPPMPGASSPASRRCSRLHPAAPRRGHRCPRAREHFLALHFAPPARWAITRALAGIHCAALEAGKLKDPRPPSRRRDGLVPAQQPAALRADRGRRVAAREAGVLVGIGSDWSPSGSKNLFGELKAARGASAQFLPPDGPHPARDIVAMATRDAARILGWQDAARDDRGGPTRRPDPRRRQALATRTSTSCTETERALPPRPGQRRRALRAARRSWTRLAPGATFETVKIGGLDAPAQPRSRRTRTRSSAA